MPASLRVGKTLGVVSGVLAALALAGATPPVEALGSRPPSGRLQMPRLQQTSRVMVSGGCTAQDVDSVPMLSASFTVWDGVTVQTAKPQINLVQVLEDKLPTTEFVFSATFVISEHFSFGDAPLAGRLAFTSGDCGSLTVGAYLEDALDAPKFAPYAVHAGPLSLR